VPALFLDTNILVYSFSGQDVAKRETARAPAEAVGTEHGIEQFASGVEADRELSKNAGAAFVALRVGRKNETGRRTADSAGSG
jgi:predicted nucleic acid-binding protein